jgi:hypothetical protein
MFRLGFFAASALLVLACADEGADAAASGSGSGGGGGDTMAEGGGGGGPSSGPGGPAATTGGDAGSGGGATGSGGGGGGGEPALPCGCLLGEGPYCAARVGELAAEAGCTTPFLEGHDGDLMKCEGDVWSPLEACADGCAYDGTTEELDDGCVLPECECFVQVAWCGSGAADVAAEMGCRIPLLPEHNGDILHCPGGEWAVKQSCDLGCVEAPQGTPDYCNSDSEYLLPFACDVTRTCSSGNHTSNHDGKDEYAYDFATAQGTSVRAMRTGTVLRVRNVSTPGDGCYDGGGSACANYANTVEVKHSDGTVALYMHLSEGTVGVGDPVAQGDELGRSGNSGWSTGPHLHVQVQEDCGIWWCQSVPFAFVEGADIATGDQVTSQNDCPP